MVSDKIFNFSKSSFNIAAYGAYAFVASACIGLGVDYLSDGIVNSGIHDLDPIPQFLWGSAIILPLLVCVGGTISGLGSATIGGIVKTVEGSSNERPKAKLQL